jgi:biotin carboxyl carrier protein
VTELNIAVGDVVEAGRMLAVIEAED